MLCSGDQGLSIANQIRKEKRLIRKSISVCDVLSRCAFRSCCRFQQQQSFKCNHLLLISYFKKHFSFAAIVDTTIFDKSKHVK